MRMVLTEPFPKEIDDLLARRRAHGLDTHDEVWNGEYHMSPAAHPDHAFTQSELHGVLRPIARRAELVTLAEINVGTPNDFRVPDLVVARRRPVDLYVVDDVAIVVEVLSARDEAWQKFDHYADHGVTEIFMVDPQAQTVQFFVRPADGTEFVDQPDSPLLSITTAWLADRLDW